MIWLGSEEEHESALIGDRGSAEKAQGFGWPLSSRCLFVIHTNPRTGSVNHYLFVLLLFVLVGLLGLSLVSG